MNESGQTPAMTREQVRAWRDRWQALADLERRELQTASLELRWRQLNAVVQMLQTLGITMSEKQDDVEAVRRRWIALKRHYP